MKTPSFWNSVNLISNLLLPLGYIYAAATEHRVKKTPRRADKPVICIGNLTAGGTGKTPTALAIAEILQQNGRNPYFVSRGYGGKCKDLIVNPQIHTAAEVGDEPLLLAQKAKVSINPERYLAACKAIADGADCIIMDDGFQNPTLYKDLSLLVFDGEAGIGNGRPVPAGPLRENFAKGLKRADAAIILGKDCHNLAAALSDLPIFYGQVTPVVPSAPLRPALAFAGIGRPEKFYNSLCECQVELRRRIDFPDHHFYTIDELQQLIDTAQQENLDLFTTGKDFVKIPALLRKHFRVLEIGIKWQNPDKLAQFILPRLNA